jgi:hypothetical protein
MDRQQNTVNTLDALCVGINRYGNHCYVDYVFNKLPYKVNLQNYHHFLFLKGTQDSQVDLCI